MQDKKWNSVIQLDQRSESRVTPVSPIFFDAISVKCTRCSSHEINIRFDYFRSHLQSRYSVWEIVPTEDFFFTEINQQQEARNFLYVKTTWFTLRLGVSKHNSVNQ